MTSIHPPHQLLGILGHPLGHSLSPALHTWVAQQLKLERAYFAWDKSAEEIEAFLKAVRALPVHGLSVTIPYKRAVMDHVDEVSARAREIGAANTLFWRHGRLCAENTDVDGFMAGLEGLSPRSALVLGAGGAARAVAWVLRRLNIPRRGVANRNVEKAQALAEEFGLEIAPWDSRTSFEAELLVNTTPLGMLGERVHLTPWPAEAFLPGQVAYDLVYNPLQTRFLREAAEAGATTVDGLTMFLGQAMAQHALWTPDGPGMPMASAREFLIDALQ